MPLHLVHNASLEVADEDLGLSPLRLHKLYGDGAEALVQLGHDDGGSCALILGGVIACAAQNVPEPGLKRTKQANEPSLTGSVLTLPSVDIVSVGIGVQHDIAVSLKELAVQGSRDRYQVHLLNAPHLQSRLLAGPVELLLQNHDCRGTLEGRQGLKS